MTRKAKGRRPVGSYREGTKDATPKEYATFISELKDRIRVARSKAFLSVNRELIGLYWHIGRAIVERQRKEGWGESIVDRLSTDIQREFPKIKGFSPRNIWRMRAFYLAWTEEILNLAQAAREIGNTQQTRPGTESDPAIVPQAVAELPWSHNVILVEKLNDPRERLWYAHQAVEHGWSRAMLVHWIDSDLYGRQGKAVTNFRRTLPPPQSDLAEEALKDPYVFDFLTLDTEAREREIERGLLVHLREFLLELGVGFAFVGQQVHLEVGEEDFYVDLLFYHLRLRCFVVIDLKTKPFTPEDAGKMNFYLSAVDDRLRHPDDMPSIGLILCKPKSSNRLIAEYALRDMSKPIGVSQYQLSRALPSDLRSSLPTIEALEAELSRVEPTHHAAMVRPPKAKEAGTGTRQRHR